MTTNTSTGQHAETIAAEYLQQRGYEVIERNFRNRWCEIDIIAQKAATHYFVEVKYRQNHEQGDGLEYITPKKLRQMAFAAELWRSNHRQEGAYCLAGLEVTGDDFDVTTFIDSLT